MFNYNMGLLSFMGHKILAVFLLFGGAFLIAFGIVYNNFESNLWLIVFGILIMLASFYFFKTKHT